MTFASTITIARILLVPLIVVLAFRYGASLEAGEPIARLRWAAVGLFIIAALSDALDGWVARRFDQRSQLGGFLDPLADKLLMGWGVLVGTLVDWGEVGWHLPMWFAIVVWSRDGLIVLGLIILKRAKRNIEFKAHVAGKYATAAQFITLAWVTFGIVKVDPVWPCMVATFFAIWSAVAYFQQAVGLMKPAD